METRKRRWGDRKDGYRLHGLDPMHAFVPYLMPNRADNEAFIQEQVDLTNLLAYLDKKNENETDFKYTMFHVIAAAIVKTVVLRPHLNRFIKGCRVYQRNDISLAFVVKKEFNDESHEALAFIKFDENSTVDSVHELIKKEVRTCRSDKLDNSTQGMDMLSKLPRWFMRIVMAILRRLDFYGRVPDSLIKTDPNHATVFISNLGSIKLNAGYHHLTNWGTNSVFIVIGAKHKAPFYDDDGNVEMRTVLELGLTLDERISDGYYYSKSVQLFKHLLTHPELLELPAKEEVKI
ncbi:MAG: 2-oxo acid dehydrogenase subunit E2 [Clostridia bacterium]|nr:2-oxo acid dehydrogenase subunit E2 [Clostridia bacterium]